MSIPPTSKIDPSPAFNDRAPLSPFQEALQRKALLAEIKTLIPPANLNLIDQGMPLIVAAFRAEREDVVEYLLQQGANPFLYDSSNENLLSLVVRGNCETLLAHILRHPEIRNYINHGLKKEWVKTGVYQSLTPLLIATEMGWITCLKMLLEAGADTRPPLLEGVNGQGALGWACMLDQTDVALVLIEHYIKNRGKKNCGQIDEENTDLHLTPLQESAQRGNIVLVQALLIAHANPCKKDLLGYSPFQRALNSQTVKAIIEGNIVASQENMEKEINSKLNHIVNGHAPDPKMVEVLLNGGADPTIKNERGQNLFILTLSKDQLAAAWASLNAFRKREGKKKLEGDGTFPKDYTGVHFAAEYAPEQMEALLKTGKKPQVLDSLKRSPLSLACGKGHIAAARSLLLAGADVNARVESDELTPLHIAVRKGYRWVVALLLENGAQLLTTLSGLSPLHMACLHGRLGVAAQIYSHEHPDDKMELRDPFEKDLSLQEWTDLVLKELPYCIEKILKTADHTVLIHAFFALADSLSIEHPKKAELHKLAKDVLNEAYKALSAFSTSCQCISAPVLNRTVGYLARTPLHIAAREGHTELVKLLMQLGALPKFVDAWGHSPLDKACFHNHTETALALLEGIKIKGKRVQANVQQYNPKTGEGPLHVAAFTGNTALIEAVLKRGAPANVKTKEGQVPLKVSYRKNPGKILAWVASNENETPLSIACERGHLEAVRALLRSRSADVSQTVGKNNETLLSRAAKRGNPEIILALLAAGAEPTQRSPTGKMQVMLTPFHMACAKGDLPAVQAFLRFPKKVLPLLSIKNGKFTPLEWARKAGNSELVDLLQQQT